VEEAMDLCMQNMTINAMTATLIVFCGLATGMLGWAVTVKYLL